MSILSQTFGFHPVATTCVPTFDENFAETAEHPRLTVLCVFWNQSLIVSLISALSTIVSKKTIESLDTTQPSIKYGDLFWFATNFECLDSVPTLPLPHSATMKMSSRYLKEALKRRSCITSCFRIDARFMTQLVTDFTTCDKLDASSLFNFGPIFQPSIIVLLLASEKKQAVSFYEMSVLRLRMETAIFAGYWCSSTTKKSLTSALITLSFGPTTNFSSRSWNASTEFRLCNFQGYDWFQLPSNLLTKKDQQFPGVPSELRWGRHVLVVCVFKLVCNSATTLSIPNLALSRGYSFNSAVSWWVLTDLVHFQ